LALSALPAPSLDTPVPQIDGGVHEQERERALDYVVRYGYDCVNHGIPLS